MIFYGYCYVEKKKQEQERGVEHVKNLTFSASSLIMAVKITPFRVKVKKEE
jgi:hypothetical protein